MGVVGGEGAGVHIATGKKSLGDTTTLDDYSGLAKLRETDG